MKTYLNSRQITIFLVKIPNSFKIIEVQQKTSHNKMAESTWSLLRFLLFCMRVTWQFYRLGTLAKTKFATTDYN